MVRRAQPATRPAETGFSMIEMLMTAFILAVGLLGLALFQTMTLKVARGNTSVTTATLLAEQIMDQAEMEGRLSWLNVTDTSYSTPSNGDLKGLYYLAAVPGTITQYFNAQSSPLVKPDDPTIFYTVVTKVTNGTAATVGNIATISTTVTFNDYGNTTNNNPIPRSVFLTRSIVHG